MAQEQSSVRIDKPTPAEAELLRLLSPAEKLEVLIAAAAMKAGETSADVQAARRQRKEQK